MRENFHSNEEQILPVGYILADRYVLDAFLGSGGMGAVYKAHDRLLEDKTVAIKILHKEFSRDSELTRRFLREVNMMHSVNHPNVVRTYDAGVQDGLFFFTMEYIEGLLLDRYLETLGRDYALLGKITAQICKGLEAIHNQNIVHRDLKPGNILVSNDGTVKITDFGVARPVSSGHTAHREIMGSLDYIPPEVFQGNQISPASDFYSLGVILYGIVCGVFPFDAEDPMAIVWKHVNEIPAAPSTRNPEVPNWMDKLIMRLLEKDPARRPQNARHIIRFIRENIFKDGRILDSGSHQVSKTEQKAINLDTDIFELDIDPSDLESDDESSFLSMNTDSFTSACNQVIFDALPTVDKIRQHEELWEERKKKRGEGQNLKGLAAKIKQAEKNEEIKKIRIAIQVIGFIVVFSLIIAISTFMASPKEEVVKVEDPKTVSIQQLKKDYMSGRADVPRAVATKSNSKADNWKVPSLIPPSFEQDNLQNLSFDRLNIFKGTVDYLSSDSTEKQNLTPPPVISDSQPIQMTQERVQTSNADLRKQVLTQPAISTEYKYSPALTKQIESPTEEQKKLFFEKKKLKEELTTLNGQINAYDITDEQALSEIEKSQDAEVEKIKNLQLSVDVNMRDQLERQKSLLALVSELDRGGLIKVGKDMSKVNSHVAETFNKYVKSEEAYREMMDSVKDGKLAFDKIAINEVSEELTRQRKELEQVIKKAINDSVIESFGEMVETGAMSDVATEKATNIGLEKQSRREFWKQIKSGDAYDKSVLENRKAELESKLKAIENNLTSQQESAIRGLVAAETFKDSTKDTAKDDAK